MEIQEILLYIGGVIVVLTIIIRMVNNIRNGRKWYHGDDYGGE
jgi:hypothetical protein